MFSDVISDITEILKDSISDAFPAVYPATEVIKLFEQLEYVQMLSDARGIGGLCCDAELLRKLAKKHAEKFYNKYWGLENSESRDK